MRNWIRILLIILNLFVAVGLIASAYAGMVSPDVTPIAGALAMTFVFWLCIALLLLMTDLIVFRKLTWVMGGALLVCYGPIHTFCPINFRKHLTVSERQRSFTVMNYNVEGFLDESGINSYTPNRTMQYILDSDADIICLQECPEFEIIKTVGVCQQQIDSLIEKYPYYGIHEGAQAIFSKYPLARVSLPINKFDNGVVEAYTLAMDGQTLTIFNVHLQSLSLTDDDRQLYMSLTRKITENKLKKARTQLFSKLGAGFRERAVQANAIKDYIETIGGNIIVCGDFNDIPDCYTIRILERVGLKDAYTEAGFGPMITYHTDRFYFRIDHSLYRGHFDAVSCKCGKIGSSDHYPLITTYVWDK